MKIFTINFNESKKNWDNFISQSPQRNIFLHTNFMDSLKVNYNLVTCYLNGKIVIGAPIIFSEKNLPLEHPFPFTQFQGLVLADNSHMNINSKITLEIEIVEYFISVLTQNFKKIYLSNSWRFRDIRPFLWFGFDESESKNNFTILPRYTGIMDLKKNDIFEKVLLSIRAVRRQEYNKALQKMQFIYSDEISILDDLHSKTFERQNIKRGNNASDLIKSIASSALNNNYGKLCLAIQDKKPIAAILFLYDDRTAYYLISANDPDYRKFNANTFLMLNMIKDAIDRKCLEIDFCGLNSPNRGDFKVSFNAEPRIYFNCSLE